VVYLGVEQLAAREVVVARGGGTAVTALAALA